MQDQHWHRVWRQRFSFRDWRQCWWHHQSFWGYGSRLPGIPRCVCKNHDWRSKMLCVRIVSRIGKKGPASATATMAQSQLPTILRNSDWCFHPFFISLDYTYHVIPTKNLVSTIFSSVLLFNVDNACVCLEFFSIYVVVVVRSVIGTRDLTTKYREWISLRSVINKELALCLNQYRMARLGEWINPNVHIWFIRLHHDDVQSEIFDFLHDRDCCHSFFKQPINNHTSSTTARDARELQPCHRTLIHKPSFIEKAYRL